MKKVLLYWNHICILHKKEKEFIEKAAEMLLAQGIELSVKYFGLGYEMHMSTYLAQPDAILPDLIVSADLEVFEHNKVFDKFKNNLHLSTGLLPQKTSSATQLVQKDAHLLPLLAIPLVYYTNEPKLCQNKALHQIESLAFGGINNSAAKTVVKTIWSEHGKDTADSLLANSNVVDMPIVAFSQVKKGFSKVALVPSVYALSSDEQTSFLRHPSEGPLLIPSYLCAMKSIDFEVAKAVSNAIFCESFCDFYVENADLIMFIDKTDKQSRQENEKYYYPKANWFDDVKPTNFYELYTKHLPTAVAL